MVNEKKIIGLTGIYCAGKNHVAQILEKRGFPVLDVDKLGHLVIESEREPIIFRFGNDILTQDGHIDRKKLGAKVFGRPEEMAALEEIIHPAANRETLAWISGCKEKTLVINAALLHRAPVPGGHKAIILVEAPVLTRLFRARKRDRLPWKALFRRFSSQRNFSSQYSGKNTDIYRVKNRFSSKKLERRVDEILSLLGIR